MGGFYSRLPLPVLDLHLAIVRGEYAEVEQHVRKFGADINHSWVNANDLEEQDAFGMPLSTYLYRPNTDYVLQVISPSLSKKGITTIILATATRNTPLHVCICNSAVTLLGLSNGFEKRSAELIQLGADVNAVNSYGRTPLHYSAVWGLDGLVIQLINANSDVDCIDYDGRTPLHFCVEPFLLGRNEVPEVFFVRNIAVVKVLIMYGCDLLNLRTWVEKHRKLLQVKLKDHCDAGVWLDAGNPESLKQLCRASILNFVNRDSLTSLPLPKCLITFLQKKMISV